jgi:hypothetical protein
MDGPIFLPFFAFFTFLRLFVGLGFNGKAPEDWRSPRRYRDELTPSAVRHDIFVDYDGHKTSSPVRGGIFWKPGRAMSLLRSYGIFNDGCYKYAAPNGAEKADEICKNGNRALRRPANRPALPAIARLVRLCPPFFGGGKGMAPRRSGAALSNIGVIPSSNKL